jgi:hypothetical protein
MCAGSLKKVTKMAEKEEGGTALGRSHTSAAKPDPQKPLAAKSKRKAVMPTLTDDLTGKFLRVGNKLYRTSEEKGPFARLEPDRLKTSRIDALPDVMRIAKANGWASIRINGGDTFKKAAFLAAAAQGLTVENYTPSKLVQAEADRLQTRVAERAKRLEARGTSDKLRPPAEETITLKALSERFLSQTHEQNAGDPDLRRAQSLVAQTILITRAKYPDDPVKASKEVEARRQEVARRIASGHKIAIIQVRNQQAQRAREITRDQVIQRDGRSR